MRFVRYFTPAARDAYEMIHFRPRVAEGDGFDAPLEHPEGWPLQAVEMLADEAACSALPPVEKAIEENTVPSWLWRRSQAALVGGYEASVRHVFDRVAGAAAYRGWKLGLFAGEEDVRAFYDDARYALATRLLSFEPRLLATVGVEWAYGVTLSAVAAPVAADSRRVDVTNDMIDAVVSGRRDRKHVADWQKLIAARARAGQVSLHFADTEAQWEIPAQHAAAARINLLPLRHTDGTVNSDAVRHLVRLAVLLADLNDLPAPALAIGHANLAALLMALALPFDSDAARATASAIAGVMTAEAFAVSAELAALRGAAPAFAAHRESCLRALRNHRRAAYGEHNDYEKIAVTPLPLALAAGPDLALSAAVRTGWDKVLELAQAHGLRHVQLTGQVESPTLTEFMACDSAGFAPLAHLCQSDSEDRPERVLHASVGEALARLGYNDAETAAIARHVTGYGTLAGAPAINPEVLRKHKMTDDAIERVESYLPHARHLRHALTVWNVGPEWVRKKLKVSAAKLEDMAFNLPQALGFSAAEVDAANAWVYGHDTLDTAPGLKAAHRHVFATASLLPVEAVIRMAAAAQGFVSGDTALTLRLPVGLASERFEKLLLDAWRHGVKALTIVFDAALPPENARRLPKRKQTSAVFQNVAAPSLPRRSSRRSARTGLVARAKSGRTSPAKAH